MSINIQPRKGAIEYLSKWKPIICSAGWSHDLISNICKLPKIYSNELVFNEESSTGEIALSICSSRQKLRVFENEIGAIYIGDSLTDVQCLVSAFAGIILESSESASLKTFLNLRQIKILTVVDAPSPGIYWATDWNEIDQITTAVIDKL